jgi:murein DD-endopeptidase MepM/ murein hydrolase activator NlpD
VFLPRQTENEERTTRNGAAWTDLDTKIASVATRTLLGCLVVSSALLIAASRVRALDAIEVHEASRAMQPGELVVFTIDVPPSTELVSVTAFGHAVPAFRAGADSWRALVGIDLDVRPGPHTAVVTARTPAGALTADQTLIIVPKHFPTRTLKVNPDFVEPPPGELPRIKREAARLGKLWASSSPQALWSGAFVRPVADAANSRFGSRSVFNGKPGSPHTGADFLSGAGTPIKAPNAGIVVLAENLYFSGNTVVVDHGLGLFSLFAHLSEFEVHEGDTVATNDRLGLVGATGRVTGPHLHWAVRASGARIDPLSLLAVLGQQ